MAILQEANAVFYHPLDDSTESLQTLPWSGPAEFSSAKVALGMDGSVASIAPFGPSHEFKPGTIGFKPAVASMSSTKFVVVYSGDTTGFGTARVGTVSGTDITYGTPALFQNIGQSDWPSIGILDASRFLVLYSKTSSGSGFTGIRVGTVIGTSIAYGIELLIAGPGANLHLNASAIAILSSTTAVIGYTHAAAGNTFSRVATVSGTTVTLGATTDIITGKVGSIGAAPISATSCVFAYSDTGIGKAKIGTVAGTAVALGTAVTFGASVTHDMSSSVAALGVSTFIVAYVAVNAPNKGEVRVGSFVGDAIVFGAVTEVDGNVTDDISVAAFSDTEFVVSYEDGVSDRGRTRLGTVSGTVASFGPASDFFTPTDSRLIRTAIMTPTTFVNIYHDTASRGHATVGALAGASLVGADAVYGTEKTLLTGGIAQNISCAKLTSTQVIIVFQDNSDSSGKVKLATISGSDITIGAATTFLAGLGASSVAALSSTKYVIAYENSGSSSRCEVIVGELSGTDSTFGSAVAANANNGASPSITVLDSTTAVVAYRDGADNDHGTVKVATVSGLAATLGPEKEFHSSALSGAEVNITALDSSKFVVAYRNAATNGTAKVGTVSGTDVTFGVDTGFSGSNVGTMDVERLTDTKVVVCYRNNIGGAGIAKIGTISGTDITFGAVVEFKAAAGAERLEVTAMSSDRFAVAYRDTGEDDNGTSQIGTVSGTSITFSAEVEFQSAATFQIGLAAVSSTAFLIAYSIASPVGGGTRIGTIGAVSAYPTTVGATRLAFSGWTRSPNIALPTTTTSP